ncbi:hypothetical protein PYCCODRAFT_1457690 [Trametes coccinea BRFM310]|uniref:Alcohol acetyltransferase n=1 Tax=Trametes coccinea (strain BRFM310) TaxID=1353009 RepID=A0A1Y2IXS5_TRAC3|nr:hypothetical protein PYCCODRAFT_1457690 [Trametes coccinea BRFM310]
MTTSSSEGGKKHMREAGRFEQFFHARSQLSWLLWVVVSAKYHHDAGATLDKPTLFTALERVVYAHPALACRLESCGPAKSPPVWVRLPAIDLNKVVDFRDEQSTQLEQILEALYAAPLNLPDDVPCWKLLVLRDGAVIFAYQHTIGDGQSGMAFHAALLSALRQTQGPVLQHSGILTYFPEDASLVPAMEDCMDVSVPFSTLVGELGKGFLPSFLRKDYMSWSGKPVPQTAVHGATIRILRYSPDEAASLIQLSRAHNTTLTGLLHSLALVVLSRLIRALPDAQDYRCIGTTIPLSLRRYTGTSPVAFCNHVSAHSDYYPLLSLAGDSDAAVSVDNFPWGLAAKLSTTLKEKGPSSAATVGLLKYLSGEYEKYLLGFLGKKRPSALELSNLGPFPVKHVATPTTSGGSWSINEVFFAQALVTLGSAILLNVAGAESGAIGMTVTWGKESVEDDFAHAFVAGLKTGIEGLLASCEGA